MLSFRRISLILGVVIFLQVKRDFMCLYCNSNRQPFNSLEAVRKHMVAKSHCKVHFGDDDEEEEAELEEFYDYSSRFVFGNVFFKSSSFVHYNNIGRLKCLSVIITL